MPTDLLDTLCALLPAQLDLVIAKLQVTVQYLPGPGAPLATRAVDLLRWAEQQGRRADLERLCAQMVPSSVAASVSQASASGTTAAPPRLRPWGAKLTGAELAELTEALLRTFPTRTGLAQMLRFGLDKNLDALTASNNLNATVFELLTTAEAQGWITDLFEAAYRQVPGSPTLRAIAEKRMPPEQSR